MTEMQGIEFPVNSRFSISANPDVAPGFCAVCRNPGGDGRWFVDFGFQLDWYGAVYFCSTCMTEAAQGVGYVPKPDRSVVEVNKKLLDDYDKLIKEFNDYRDSARNILRYCNCDLPSDEPEASSANKASAPASRASKSKAT